MSENLLRLAVQKSGRLSEDSLSLLAECGVGLNLSGSRSGKLRVQASNFPLEVFFLRDDDIPGYIADGVVDIGIVGENVVLETKTDVLLIERLGFARCRLSVAVPKISSVREVADLNGKKIATSYPVVLRQFLDERRISASIHEISGSVEIAPGMGLADAICDLVSSGSTLISNGLVELETVLRSEAVLVADKNIVAVAAEKQKILDRLQFRIQSVLRAKQHKYVVLNSPNDAINSITELLPGMKSPTIIPLAQEGWSAVHSVVTEDAFWEIIESLKAAGAQGILVVPIEKMVG